MSTPMLYCYFITCGMLLNLKHHTLRQILVTAHINFPHEPVNPRPAGQIRSARHPILIHARIYTWRLASQPEIAG